MIGIIFFLFMLALIATHRPSADSDLKALAKIDKRVRKDIERSKRDNR